MKNTRGDPKHSWLKQRTKLFLLFVWPVFLVGCTGSSQLLQEYSYFDNGLVFRVPEGWKASILDEDGGVQVFLGSGRGEIEYLSGGRPTLPSPLGVMGWITIADISPDEIDGNPEQFLASQLNDTGTIAQLTSEQTLQNARGLEFTDLQIDEHPAIKVAVAGTLIIADERSENVVVTEASFISEDLIIDIVFVSPEIEHESQAEIIDAAIQSLRLNHENFDARANFRGSRIASDLLNSIRDSNPELAKDFVCTEAQGDIDQLFAEIDYLDVVGHFCSSDGTAIQCDLYWNEEGDIKQEVLFERKDNLVCGWLIR
jgi:hypothetical protein